MCRTGGHFSTVHLLNRILSRCRAGSMAHKKNNTPSLAQIRVAAAHAGCDPRTLLRLLAGQPVRGIAGERALAALKLIPPT